MSGPQTYSNFHAYYLRIYDFDFHSWRILSLSIARLCYRADSYNIPSGAIAVRVMGETGIEPVSGIVSFHRPSHASRCFPQCTGPLTT